MDNSPLRKLPAEMRNEIYYLVLVNPRPITINLHDKHAKARLIKHFNEAEPGISGLGLLRTCREVHDEAASIFYGSNKFLLDTELFTHDTVYGRKYGSEGYVTQDRNQVLLRRRDGVKAQRRVLKEGMKRLGENAQLLRQVEMDLGTWWTSLEGAQKVHQAVLKFQKELSGEKLQVTFAISVRWRIGYDDDTDDEYTREHFNLVLRPWNLAAAEAMTVVAIGAARAKLEKEEREDPEFGAWGEEPSQYLGWAEEEVKMLFQMIKEEVQRKERQVAEKDGCRAM
jgi:hypothetical protein